MKAIQVENLAKAYLVGHNVTRNGASDTLRGILSCNAKNLARKTRYRFTGSSVWRAARWRKGQSKPGRYP